MKVNNGHRPSEKEHIRILTLWCKCAHRPKISPCPLKYHCSASWPHIRVAFRGGNGDIYIYLFMFFFHLKLLTIIYFWTALIRTIFSKGQKRSLWNDIFFADPKEVLFVPSAIGKVLSMQGWNAVIQAALLLFSTLQRQAFQSIYSGFFTE